MQPGTYNNQVLEVSNMGPRFLRLYPMISICQFVFQNERPREPRRPLLDADDRRLQVDARTLTRPRKRPRFSFSQRRQRWNSG